MQLPCWVCVSGIPVIPLQALQGDALNYSIGWLGRSVFRLAGSDVPLFHSSLFDYGRVCAAH